MKGQIITLFLGALCLASIAGADDIILQPNPVDLYDLEHGHYYTWGIELDLSNIRITGATLFIDNIKNHSFFDYPNDLWIQLLDDAPLGVTSDTDSTSGQDNEFDGQGHELVHYHNLPGYAQDKIYDFDNNEVLTVISYLQNGGNFALGFDPDCHFYNDGVTLTLHYDVVPEPSTLGLLAGGVFFLRRRQR